MKCGQNKLRQAVQQEMILDQKNCTKPNKKKAYLIPHAQLYKKKHV